MLRLFSLSTQSKSHTYVWGRGEEKMFHTQMLLNRLGSERQKRHNRILQRIGIDEPFFTQMEADAVANTVRIYDCKGLLTPNEMRALLGLPEIKEGVKK